MNFYNLLPTKLQIDITSKCNSRCPQCPRTFESTMMESPHISQEDFSINLLNKVLLDPYMKDIQKIFLNGNYGDFVMYDNPKKLIETFLSYENISNIKINTNGGAQSKSFWQWLGTHLKVFVEFSIDGLADTHSLYRRNTRYDVVLKNARTFIDAGGTAIWSMVVFEHNEHQIDECRSLAKKYGFKMFNMRPSPRWGKSDGQWVYDNNYNPLYKIKPASFIDRGNKKLLISEPTDPELFERAKEQLTNLQAPLDKVILEDTEDIVDCHAQKESTIYLGADGRIWPCCWMEIESDFGFRQREPKSFNWYFYNKLGYKKNFNNVNTSNLSDIVYNTKLFSGLQKLINNNSCDTCRAFCSKKDRINAKFDATKEKIQT